MAELQEKTTTEIIPLPAQGSMVEMTQGDMGRYVIKIRELDAAGKGNDFGVAVPNDIEWQRRMLLAAILKKTTWKNFDMPTIFHAIIYAETMGLDLPAGDVYMAAEGRLSTTAGAKIRHAMSTGKIVGYTVDITDGPVTQFKYKSQNADQVISIPNYSCKVMVKVRDWDAPMVYETTLTEWFEGRNPNWRMRPKYMLRRNALSKALEEVAPMGVEGDEAPPVAPTYYEAGEVGQVSKSVGTTGGSRIP